MLRLAIVLTAALAIIVVCAVVFAMHIVLPLLFAGNVHFSSAPH